MGEFLNDEVFLVKMNLKKISLWFTLIVIVPIILLIALALTFKSALIFSCMHYEKKTYQECKVNIENELKTYYNNR